MQTGEMVECESCNTIGCVRCITKIGGRWLCGSCRSGNQYNSYEERGGVKTESSPESALAAMFG
jgi:hypothetical protein